LLGYLVHTHLERLAFEPSLNFSKTFAISSKMLIPWATLFEWIQRVREARLGIICWHEERPFEIAALQQLGVDGICSDAPELLKV